MVVLNKIYTRTGDDGTTALGDGSRVPKASARVEAYGTVDETNAIVGIARLHVAGDKLAILDPMLARIQNDLFDLGADLCTPQTDTPPEYPPLRVTPEQTTRLETEIDELNADLAPLRSFVLPGGHAAAAHLHHARTVARRAERQMTAVTADPGETIAEAAMKYINRLSDFFFVASRWVNHQHNGDVLWVPGQNTDKDKS